MPRLPDVQSARPVPTPAGGVARYQATSPAFLAPALATAGMGEVIQNMGESLYVADQQLQRARQASELSDLLAGATAEISMAEAGAKRDTDFATLNQRFDEQIQAIGSKYGGQASGDAVRLSFQKQYQELALSKRLNVMNTAVAKEQDWRVGRLDSSTDLYARSAAGTSNPAERELITGQALIAISDAEVSGWITHTDAVSRADKLRTQIDQAQVLQDIQSDPGTAATLLSLGEDYAPSLDPVMRTNLTTQALNLAEAQRNKADQDEDARVRQAADDGLTQAYADLADRRLTRAQVDALRNPMVQAGRALEWKNLLEDFKKGPGGNNDFNPAYAQVMEMVYADPAGARSLAHSYHKQGLLKTDTYVRVLGESNTIERQGGPRSAYERGRAFLTAGLAPIPGVSDATQPFRQADAVRAFDDWYLTQTEGGKKPADAEIQSQSQAIMKRYAIVDMMAIGREVTGITTSEPKTAIDQIKAKGKQARDDLKAGRITPEEFRKIVQDLERQKQAAEKAAQ